MPYEKIDPYRRQPAPPLQESQARWLEAELRKLEQAIKALIEAVEVLQSKVP